MWTYNYNNYELYHHGVKGMKWGVRRTPEQLGYKRSKEADNLNKEWGKLAKAKSEMMDTSKKFYISGGSGNPILLYDKNKKAAYEKQQRKVQSLVDILEKRKGFKIEKLDNDWDDEGHMYTTVFLSKNGEKYISEMYNGRYH